MENSSKINVLHNLLDEDARKFTSAEIQLKNSLPGWIIQTGSFQLKIVLQKYLYFVEQHVKKMEGFFADEKINSISLSNRVMTALIDETNEKLAACALTEVKDACLLASIQCINHFKISVYGTAAAFAHALELEQAWTTFLEFEINEKHIDDRLSQLADYEVNFKAIAPVMLSE